MVSGYLLEVVMVKINFIQVVVVVLIILQIILKLEVRSNFFSYLCYTCHNSYYQNKRILIQWILTRKLITTTNVQSNLTTQQRERSNTTPSITTTQSQNAIGPSWTRLKVSLIEDLDRNMRSITHLERGIKSLLEDPQQILKTGTMLFHVTFSLTSAYFIER